MKNLLLVVLVTLTYSCNWASDLTVVNNHSTIYGIVTAVNANPKELKAAKILSHYIALSTGVPVGIYTENTIGEKPGIYIGKTKKSKEFNLKPIKNEGYVHASNTKDIIVVGGTGQGIIYGTYAFIEKFLDGRKYADEPGKVAELKLLEIPSNYYFEYVPMLVYRQAYYPMANDVEYMEWHGQQKFEDLWGIWGHSYFKLIDPRKYFKTNPEYFAFENGKRKPTQICPSNDAVVAIAINELKTKIANNPDATYWSISAEDDAAFCQCDKCAKIIKEEGGPTGPHLRFVNKIAQAFPQNTFTTLAYTYTQRAPLKTKPAANVYIMLSTIDAYRNKPLQIEPSAAGFRNALMAWEKLTPNLLAWDYTTQFTNYLAPLPDVQLLADNIRFMAQHNVKGIFSQGSGDGYGELAELKSYIIAKLVWNPALDEKELMADFFKGYYKAAGPFVAQYVDLLHNQAKASNRLIDIYGNPVNEYNTYLTPELLDQYSTLFDQAEAAIEGNEKLANKLYRARLSLDYVVLQQARFYGTERHGYLIKNESGNGYVVNPKIETKVEKFVKACKQFNVTELSEGGLTPDGYAQEWNNIFARGWKPNLAKQASIKLNQNFVPEYPAKKELTLTDEVYGANDYSYNWLCFYGNDLDAVIDLKTPQEVKSITANFLDDPRHWIFLPAQVEVYTSVDGVTYSPASITTKVNFMGIFNDEHYQASTTPIVFNLKPQTVRYIKVVAKNHPALPNWRFKPTKKVMIACDEILVE